MTTETPQAVGAPLVRQVRRVVCAAVKYDDGTMLVGARHYDAVMHEQYHRFGLTLTEAQAVQGFIDQNGEFMSREVAHGIAVAQGQILRRCGGDEKRLFSENLY